MAAGKTEEFEEEFEEGAAATEADNDEAAKAAAVKNSLTKRRVIDELLEQLISQSHLLHARIPNGRRLGDARLDLPFPLLLGVLLVEPLARGMN